MANVMKFSSDKIDVAIIVIDCSGSMMYDEDNVVAGVEALKERFCSLPEGNSIAIAISQFNKEYYPGNFELARDIGINYTARGMTALNYAICRGAEQLQKYIEEVAEITGIVPTATFVLMSDGKSEGGDFKESSAVNAIRNLNLAHINTVFIACGGKIHASFGKRLGFKATIDVEDKKSIVSFFGKTLSDSFIEQSRSQVPLGEKFFSQAESSSSNTYSQTTEQVLEDLSWIDDI